MKIFKLFALLFLSIGLLTSVVSAKPRKDDFKVLAEGFHSEIEKPFMFVARSAAAYGELRTVAKDLPDASNIDFSKNAVVVGFGGTRSTGGWTVEIEKGLQNPVIVIKGPAKDMMVTQSITTPFKAVLVPVGENDGLSVKLSNTNAPRLNKTDYRLSKGDFGFTGGFAGRQKEFTAGGTVSVLTYGNLVTFSFDLKGKGAELKRKLVDTASGTLKNGAVNLSWVDAGTFADSPRPAFAATGKLLNSKLSLSFAALPTNVADGYLGRGSLEAIKIK